MFTMLLILGPLAPPVNQGGRNGEITFEITYFKAIKHQMKDVNLLYYKKAQVNNPLYRQAP